MIRKLPIPEFSRFLIAGLANTMLTLGLFQLLITFLDSALAYSLCWIAGLLFVALAYPSFVFNVKCNWANGLAVMTVYVFVFAVGLLVLKLLEQSAINPRMGMFVVLIATTASNYIGSRLALTFMNNSKAWTA
jgi:putative flippase GtrA